MAVDVLVIGAGITGLTTAYLLKQAGVRVAVVDQKSIGSGETSHTTAHLTFVTDARLNELASRLGKKAAQAFWGAGYLAMRQIEDISLQIATLFAGSFTQFLGIESPGLMTKTDLGEFKFAAIEGFRGILHRTVKGSLKTNPIPAWAQAQVVEAWNVPTL